MKKNLTTSNSGALARLIKSAFSAALLPALLLLLTIQPGQAGSATWKTSPATGDWNTDTNWTPQTVPNSPSDTATFATSNQTAISLTAPIEVNGITYNPGASAFTTTVPGYVTLTLSGAGVTNNSGITQNFVAPDDPYYGSIIFNNSATAGSSTNFTMNANGGGVFFNDTSTAGSGVFTVNGPGNMFFSGTATAGNGTFTCNGTEGFFAFIQFSDSSTAGNSTFTLNGNGSATQCFFIATSTAGASLFTVNGSDSITHGAGILSFQTSSTAGSATLIANPGLNGGGPGQLFFTNDSTGGTARVEVFGNGTGDSTNGFLDISQRTAPGVTIGSIEGSGAVFLGANKLTVGGSNLSTAFSGVIQDGGSGGGSLGSLAKTGKGKLTLSKANTYTGGTTVSKGTLLVTNKTGSATGTGTVAVNAGTLGGTGKMSGAVTIATATSAATLAPGSGRKPGTLTTSKPLTFNALATYKVDLNSTTVMADKVVGKGVTINSGATVTVTDLGTGTLTSGTVFTIISNTATTAIAGTFSNLADGSTLIVGSNTYQASYAGGTGNDLTLTVL